MEYKEYLDKVINHRLALIIVDVQNDFITGSLALKRCPAGHDGEEIIALINELIDLNKFDLVVYSHDWHPKDHISFIDNYHKWNVLAVDGISMTSEESSSKIKLNSKVTFETSYGPIEQTMWPSHCIWNTFGAELHPNLQVLPSGKHIYKGADQEVDSYSAFGDNLSLRPTEMDNELKKNRITDVFICGIAYDYCVYSTAIDAIKLGYQTIVIDDACRGVNCDGITTAKKDLTKKGGLVVNSHTVKNMLEHKYRPSQLV